MSKKLAAEARALREMLVAGGWDPDKGLFRLVDGIHASEPTSGECWVELQSADGIGGYETVELVVEFEFERYAWIEEACMRHDWAGTRKSDEWHWTRAGGWADEEGGS